MSIVKWQLTFFRAGPLRPSTRSWSYSGDRPSRCRRTCCRVSAWSVSSWKGIQW